MYLTLLSWMLVYKRLRACPAIYLYQFSRKERWDRRLLSLEFKFINNIINTIQFFFLFFIYRVLRYIEHYEGVSAITLKLMRGALYIRCP